MITLRTQATDSERHTTKVYFLLYGSKEPPIQKESAENIVKSKKKKTNKKAVASPGRREFFLTDSKNCLEPTDMLSQ